jgi:hypothetical protein
MESWLLHWCNGKLVITVGYYSYYNILIGYEINWNKVVFGGTLYSGSEW